MCAYTVYCSVYYIAIFFFNFKNGSTPIKSLAIKIVQNDDKKKKKKIQK